MTSQPIAPELIQRVAALAGLAVPEGDLGLLFGAVQNQLAAAEQLRALDLDDVEPIVTFDPRWR